MSFDHDSQNHLGTDAEFVAILGDGTLQYFRDIDSARSWTKREGFTDSQAPARRQRSAERQAYLDRFGARPSRRRLGPCLA